MRKGMGVMEPIGFMDLNHICPTGPSPNKTYFFPNSRRTMPLDRIGEGAGMAPLGVSGGGLLPRPVAS